MFCKRIRPTLSTLPVSSRSHYILRTANMSKMTFVLGSRLYKLGLSNHGQFVQLYGSSKSNIFSKPFSNGPLCGDLYVLSAGPALPHSHSPLKGRYDKLYSLRGNITAHSSYFTLQINARVVYRLNVDYFMLLTNGINYAWCSIPGIGTYFLPLFIYTYIPSVRRLDRIIFLPVW